MSLLYSCCSSVQNELQHIPDDPHNRLLVLNIGWSAPTDMHLLQGLLVQLRLDAKCQEETIHDLLFKLLDETPPRKHWNLLVDVADRLDEAVIVDTAHKIRQKVGPDFTINACEYELKYIEDT